MTHVSIKHGDNAKTTSLPALRYEATDRNFQYEVRNTTNDGLTTVRQASDITGGEQPALMLRGIRKRKATWTPKVVLVLGWYQEHHGISGRLDALAQASNEMIRTSLIMASAFTNEEVQIRVGLYSVTDPGFDSIERKPTKPSNFQSLHMLHTGQQPDLVARPDRSAGFHMPSAVGRNHRSFPDLQSRTSVDDSDYGRNQKALGGCFYSCPPTKGQYSVREIYGTTYYSADFLHDGVLCMFDGRSSPDQTNLSFNITTGRFRNIDFAAREVLHVFDCVSSWNVKFSFHHVDRRIAYLCR